MNEVKSDLTIGLVGPCKSGKTILKRGLTAHGYAVKHIAQEHSYVPDMWQKIARPDILIYLEVSFQTTLDRSTLSWSETEYNRQLIRLGHALQHADFVIATDGLEPHQVLEAALKFLQTLGSPTE